MLLLPPAVPLTLQFTVVFDVPETVAVNCSLPLTIKEAVAGVTETVTVGAL
jgi:hypothetical protein